MKIAAAQIEAKIGDLSNNLKKHLELIRIAIKQEVDLIVFPEMSLTGYCREEGKRLAINELNPEIIELKQIAQVNSLVIVVGAPIQMEEELYIGSFILMPNGETQIYTKQFLHPGEEDYYASSFHYNPKLTIKGETILFAICADIDKEQHPLNAKENNCSLYISSIFFSKKGIPKGQEMLSKYAKKYALKILMSNCSGQVWGIESGGKSGFWNEKGALIAALDIEKSGLLIIEQREEKWVAEKY